MTLHSFSAVWLLWLSDYKKMSGWFYNRLIPLMNIFINHFIQNKLYVHHCISPLVWTAFLKIDPCLPWDTVNSGITEFLFVCLFLHVTLPSSAFLWTDVHALKVHLFQLVFFIISIICCLLGPHIFLCLSQFIHVLLAAIRFTKRTFVNVSCFIYAADVVYALFFLLKSPLVYWPRCWESEPIQNFLISVAFLFIWQTGVQWININLQIAEAPELECHIRHCAGFV